MTIDNVAGTTFKAVITGAVTFRLAEPDTAPEFTLTIVVPISFAVT
jgi:hypothetical protein